LFTMANIKVRQLENYNLRIDKKWMN
jgi:hypothetical protein